DVCDLHLFQARQSLSSLCLRIILQRRFPMSRPVQPKPRHGAVLPAALFCHRPASLLSNNHRRSPETQFRDVHSRCFLIALSADSMLSGFSTGPLFLLTDSSFQLLILTAPFCDQSL